MINKVKNSLIVKYFNHFLAFILIGGGIVSLYHSYAYPIKNEKIEMTDTLDDFDKEIADEMNIEHFKGH